MQRHELMAESVKSAAIAAGLTDDDVALLMAAHALAMEPRIATLDDDHDPAYLHPGRTVLLLLQDVGPLPSELLCAAAVHETEEEELRVALDRIRGTVGDRVGALVSELPLPGDERLLERLVTLEERARLVALAERLDQLRHAHLREDHGWWRALHEEASAVWVPVAERTHGRLADRFRHWERTFARRLRKLDR